MRLAGARATIVVALIGAVLGGCGQAHEHDVTVRLGRGGAGDCPAKARIAVRSRWHVGVGAGPVAVEGDMAWVARPQAGEVIRVGRLKQLTLHLGGTPVSLALESHRLWVAQRDANRVISIDTNNLARVTASELPVPVSVVTGPLGVWALSVDTASLYQIEPRRGVLSIPHDSPVANPIEMATVGEEIWVLGAGEQGLSPFNAKLGRIVRAGLSRPGVSLGGLSAGAAAVWLAEPRERSLLRVDPQTVSVTRVPAPHGIRPVLTAPGRCGLWIGGLSGVLALVDPQTGVLLAPMLHVGRAIGAIGSAGSEAWVSDPRDGTLTRIAIE